MSLRIAIGASWGVMAAALITQPARAQQQPPASEDLSPQDIVVTAQKREESLQKVPISLSVLGGKALDQQATGGTLEALNQVPGVAQTATLGNGAAIAIRGVSPGSPFLDGSSTVGYYLDSIPFGLVKSSAVPNTNAYDMSRVEVLRGPQGTLYGASALNGVVRVLTNDADPTRFEAKARVGASVTKGGTPSYRADAAINIPVIEDKLAVRVVGGIEHLGGWIEQPELGVKNANKSLSKNLRVKVAATPTDNLRIDLAAWFWHEHNDAANYATDAGTQSTLLPVPQTSNYNAFSGKITYDLPFMSISSATSYLKLRRTSYIDYTYISPESVLYSNLPGKMFSEEMVFNSTGTGPLRWSAGLFYRKAHDDLYQTLPGVLSAPIYWRDSSESYAAFGQITRTFADDRFEISGGLRYFHDKVGVEQLEAPGTEPATLKQTTNFHAVTPRIVATWLPSRQLTAYASYSQGFRSGFNQSPLALEAAPGLPSVQADKLHNYEVGAKGDLFGGFLTYDTAVYYITWSGVQQSGYIQYNGVTIGASINGSSASGVGTDIGITLHPAKGFDIGGNVSYNDLKQDEDVTSQGQLLYAKGSRLAYSAAWTANAFVNYAVPLSEKWDARFKASASYHSAQPINVLSTASDAQYPDPLVYESGRPLIFNASVDITDNAGKTVTLYVENLGNWNGLAQPAPSEANMYRVRPRTIGIQFETRF